MPRNKHAILLSLFISVSQKCRFTGIILFAIFPNVLRDGLSFVDDAEFYTPVNPIPEKTLVWILIRHAAPFLQHLGTNCVELLIWSQVVLNIYQKMSSYKSSSHCSGTELNL